MVNVEGWRKAGIIISVVGGIILLITSSFYIVQDRFDIISKVDKVMERSENMERRIIKLEEDKKVLNDIQYNLKRLLEKQGLDWMPFDK
jgi:hypothetical protein